MKLTDNNALNVLIVVNVFALLAIFSLLWVLWKNGMAVPEGEVVVNDSALESYQKNIQEGINKDPNKGQAEVTPPKNLTMAEKISLEVGATENLLKDEVSKQTVPVKKLEEVKSLDELSDIEYVVQYQKTKNDIQPERNISNKDVTTVRVVKGAAQSKASEFNSIDVSGLKNRAEMFNNITTRITSLMMDDKTSNDTASVKPKAWNNYLDAIKTAGTERKNEMRTIRIKEGESLWEIAVRAYGNGFLYTKIFEANPQLTNPDLIVAGQMLRVPL